MAMSSRPIRPRSQQPIRTQSQSFRPQADWRDEEKTTVLLVYLPGFVKEQVRTTYDASGRSIRVYGERRLPNNRRIRIDERYNVPENCEGSKMETQFGRGILMITFPKIKPAPVPEPEPESEPETDNGIKTRMGGEEAVSVAEERDGGKDGEGSDPEIGRSKPKAEETSPKTALSVPAETETAKLGQEKPKKITEMVHDEEERKEPAIPETVVPRTGEEEKETITEKGGDHLTDSRPGDDVIERKAKEKIIPGLKMELNESGNPLTNTVVAALVIMGVGACFFYSFGT